MRWGVNGCGRVWSRNSNKHIHREVTTKLTQSVQLSNCYGQLKSETQGNISKSVPADLVENHVSLRNHVHCCVSAVRFKRAAGQVKEGEGANIGRGDNRSEVVERIRKPKTAD